MPNLEAVPGAEINRVANALRQIDRKLPAKLRKDLKAATKPMILKAKANAKAIPVDSRDAKRLRSKIARGVGVQAATGKRVKIRIVTKMPTPDMAMIPRGFQSPRGWRHPVFGDREKWVRQLPKEDEQWFLDAMQSEQPEVMRAIQKVLEDARIFIRSQGGQG